MAEITQKNRGARDVYTHRRCCPLLIVPTRMVLKLEGSSLWFHPTSPAGKKKHPSHHYRELEVYLLLLVTNLRAKRQRIFTSLALFPQSAPLVWRDRGSVSPGCAQDMNKQMASDPPVISPASCQLIRHEATESHTHREWLVYTCMGQGGCCYLISLGRPNLNFTEESSGFSASLNDFQKNLLGSFKGK